MSKLYKVSIETRTKIFDKITSKKICWYGDCNNQIEFLSKLYELDNLPSYDRRFKTARQDIEMHTITFEDKPDYWIFTDERFNLEDNAKFLAFLCRTIHPLVRSDISTAKEICELYNTYLQDDKLKLVKNIDDEFIVQPINITTVSSTEIIEQIDSKYFNQQIQTMDKAIEQRNSYLAIGTAKEMIETCCKTILENAKNYSSQDSDNKCKDLTLPQLMKQTVKELEPTIINTVQLSKSKDSIKRLLNSLAQIVQSITELRGEYGTGHGKSINHDPIPLCYALLVTNTTKSLVTFLWDIHNNK